MRRYNDDEDKSDSEFTNIDDEEIKQKNKLKRNTRIVEIILILLIIIVVTNTVFNIYRILNR